VLDKMHIGLDCVIKNQVLNMNILTKNQNNIVALPRLTKIHEISR